jgi:sporulation-control protein spo0M
MNNTISQSPEFLIVLNCDENGQNEQLLTSEDFTSSEMITIDNYVAWQGVSNCEIENYEFECEVNLSDVTPVTIGNLFYDYNDLDANDQAIINAFHDLLVSKAIP